MNLKNVKEKVQKKTLDLKLEDSCDFKISINENSFDSESEDDKAQKRNTSRMKILRNWN